MSPDWISVFRCPSCGGNYVKNAEAMSCASCGRVVSSRGGVYRFVDAEAGHPSDRPDSVTVKIKNLFKRAPKLYLLLIYVFGTSNAGVSPKAFFARFAPSPKRRLNLGAGTQNRYGDALHVDLYAFPDIDVLADIRHLPIIDESIDAIVCQSVLEHVRHPEEILNEAKRVLVSGGHLYLTAPFMFPFHSSPDDFRRWTLEGLRFEAERAGFSFVQGGLRHGPTTALILMFTHWLGLLVSFGSSRIAELVTLLANALLAPLAHLPDFWLNRLKVSHLIASGFYVIVRKV